MYFKGMIGKTLYKFIVKPICFQIDAEKVHESFVSFGYLLSKSRFFKGFTKILFNYENKKLEQKIAGVNFKNPVLLAAGFDYEAKLVDIIGDIGFGGETIGSVTFGKYEGNSYPRLGRLKKSKSILVNKGLKSSGAKNLISVLKNRKFNVPLGISVAKTNCKETTDEREGINDYIKSLKLWKNSGIGEYYELNISCPNSFGGESFAESSKLDVLLKEVDKIKLRKPIFLKIPIDISNEEFDSLCLIACKHNVQGIIIGNLTKDRKRKEFDIREIDKFKDYKGAFSGKPTEKRGNELIERAYIKFGKKLIIIGVGGIFNAEDAYKKIKLGASLVQLISGMIFEGPGLIGEINYGLVQFLEGDGYKNINEAIGIDARKDI